MEFIHELYSVGNWKVNFVISIEAENFSVQLENEKVGEKVCAEKLWTSSWIGNMKTEVSSIQRSEHADWIWIKTEKVGCLLIMLISEA
jgi:hypothetical protein